MSHILCILEDNSLFALCFLETRYLGYRVYVRRRALGRHVTSTYNADWCRSMGAPRNTGYPPARQYCRTCVFEGIGFFDLESMQTPIPRSSFYTDRYSTRRLEFNAVKQTLFRDYKREYVKEAEKICSINQQVVMFVILCSLERTIIILKRAEWKERMKNQLAYFVGLMEHWFLLKYIKRFPVFAYTKR